MPNDLGGLLGKGFAVALVSLAVTAASLFLIFNFLATSHIGQTWGLVVFVVVTTLLILGYAMGFLTLAFLGILLFTRLWKGKTESTTEKAS